MGNESAPDAPVSADTGGPEAGPGAKVKVEKDAKGSRIDWGKFDLGRFAGSLVTAFALIVVANVGGTINSTISKAQIDVQRQIANSQLVSDKFTLYANRETAVNSLRSDVFDTLSQTVLTELEDKEFKKVALLAAFHGNFSKFIDTRPIFEAFLREVQSRDARHELRRLAKRVARHQADYIAAQGGKRDKKEVRWKRPHDGTPTSLPSIPFHLGTHEMTVVIERINDKDDDGNERLADDVENTVDVEVTIDGTPTDFSISYLDAPYIDNIFVIHSEKEVHRIALRLLDITKTKDGIYNVKLEALHFPANIIMPMDIPSAQQLQEAFAAPDNNESRH